MLALFSGNANFEYELAKELGIPSLETYLVDLSLADTNHIPVPPENKFETDAFRFLMKQELPQGKKVNFVTIYRADFLFDPGDMPVVSLPNGAQVNLATIHKEIVARFLPRFLQPYSLIVISPNRQANIFENNKDFRRVELTSGYETWLYVPESNV